MDDARKLITFERTLGDYSAAGAICSYGDVIDFVDGDKQGISIIDTCGHLEEYGQEAAAFLRQEIENGWGIEGDAAENLEKLGKKLAAMKDASIPAWEREGWFEFLSASYVQFTGKQISLAMGGGLGETLIVRSNGDVEELLMKGGVIDQYYLEGHDPAYNTALAEGELMILQSDGLLGNMRKHFYDSFSEKFRKKYQHESLSGYARGVLARVLAENLERPVEAIRNPLIERLSPYFLPKNLRDDDVTFAVVKRD